MQVIELIEIGGLGEKNGEREEVGGETGSWFCWTKEGEQWSFDHLFDPGVFI